MGLFKNDKEKTSIMVVESVHLYFPGLFVIYSEVSLDKLSFTKGS